MRCKNCNREVKSDFKYCPYCAARQIHDFGDHYEELEPPYALQPENLDDPGAILYGQVSDPRLFQPPSVPDDDLELPDDDLELPEEDFERTGEEPRSGRSKAYHVYNPESPQPPPDDFFGDFDPETRAPFEAHLPDEPDLPDLPDELDLPDEPDEPPRARDFGGKQPSAQRESWTDDDAPYVSMQQEMPDQPDKADQAAQGPGMLYKLLLLLFIISISILLSVVIYRFSTTPDPLHNFNFSTLFAVLLR